MSRRRRAALLTGLAVLLGTLAGADVARREAALREGVGPTVRILVARADVRRGAPLTPDRLGLRRVPARWAPAGAYTSPAEVAGLRAAVDLPRGADVTAAALRAAGGAAGGFALRAGERAAQVVAGAPPGGVAPGTRVDVLVTADRGDAGTTRVAVAGAEVLSTAPAEAGARQGGGPRLAATLRVTPAQALELATAEAYARDLRLLPLPEGA